MNFVYTWVKFINTAQQLFFTSACLLATTSATLQAHGKKNTIIIMYMYMYIYMAIQRQAP